MQLAVAQLVFMDIIFLFEYESRRDTIGLYSDSIGDSCFHLFFNARVFFNAS
ncbi:hypothetical protein ANO14919_009450 [Xylariales sp. No.14919]|nr:hypothetical protein ANO14919_009450 [Xylariales sp. No.14919]